MSIFDDIGSIFEAPVDAVQDVVSFLQWISWLFNPINWLRMVEFVIGSLMFYLGVRMLVRQHAPSLGSQVRQIVADVPGIGSAERRLVRRKEQREENREYLETGITQT